VESLGMAADAASRSYTAKIAVKNSEHLLRDGMVAEARIFGAAQVHVLTVPGNAVVRDERGVESVYVYDSARHTAYARRVEAASFLGNEVVISRGLENGDRVIVAGEQNLREGAPVVLAGGAQ
jgi:multidrug efflux pump subunit AcrA (membrane-fusion protein)